MNWLVNFVKNPSYQPWLVAAVLGAVNAGLWTAVLKTFPREAPAAILHYSVGVGVDFIGEGRQIMALPAVGSVLLVLTVLLALVLSRVSMASAWILIGSNAVVQISLAVAYMYILALN